MKANISRTTLIAAYGLAICADLIQICFVPLLSEGIASPIDDFLDVVMCVILCLLIGFHVAFLPSFFIKLVPVLNIAPTWTLAVVIATRHLRAPGVDGQPVVDVSATVSAEGPGSKPPHELK